MINVLEIIDTYKIGGPGKTIINTARYINKNNYYTYVCSFDKMKQTEFGVELERLSIPHISLWDGRGIGLKNIKTLGNVIRNKNIRIIHTHGFKSDLYGFIIKLIFPHIKLITTQHGYINNDLKAKFNNTIARLFLIFFNKIIYVSYDMLNKAKDNNIIKRKTEIVHNAIIYENYQKTDKVNGLKTKYGICENDFVVGYVGRLSCEKGVLELIDIIKKIKEKDPSLKLVIIGDGYLSSIIREKNKDEILKQDIILTGHVHPISEYYDLFNVLISPSKTEGLSNTILEGLAKEVPVIATNVGGNSEILENLQNGFLINELEDNFIEEYISIIKKDSKIRKRIIENGLKTIKNKFNFIDRTKKIEKIYSDLIASERF